MNLLDLSEKTLLITGGCGAIGQVVVRILAEHVLAVSTPAYFWLFQLFGEACVIIKDTCSTFYSHRSIKKVYIYNTASSTTRWT